ncbi:hypothetical protein [Clostridium sp. DJ247]|uniref:hypothetical protein n=1 Tax=Clostridium sp. DJ247 TaxID=2726188 RepID=UPI001623BB70|nr:hypothetical protein [Clostridium sp. DJ247]MBC2580008.1 hypothetical protein [Clostridium sp. DJ247]
MSVSIKINQTTLNYNNIYYVNSVTGLDTNNGTSSSSPFKTVTKAYNSCIDGDAIYLIGVTGANYNDFTSAITKQIDIIGDGVLSQITGASNTAFFSSSTKNVNLYRVNIYGQELFRGSTGTVYNFYNCIVKLNYCLVGYDASAGVYKFYNCILDARGLTTYGLYRDNATFTNCLFIGNCNQWGGYGASILNTCIVNDTFVSSSSNYTTSSTSYSVLTLDSNYNIGGISCKNIGTGTNPNGTIANIGIYGGTFGLGTWTIYKYLVQQGIDIYAIKSSFYNKIGQAPVTEDNFLNYGADDLTALTTSQTQNTVLGIDKGILGTGKYFELSLENDFQSVNSLTYDKIFI